MNTSGIPNINTLSFKPVRAGAEGYVTGIDISADGLRKVVSTDTASAYIKDSTDTEWRPLLTTANMPTSLYDPKVYNNQTNLADEGTYAAIMAPSNKDIIYVGWNAYILLTTTAGVGANSWVKLNLPAKRMQSNSGGYESRLFNNKFAVHPTLPYTFMVGTQVDGVYYTTNANLGASCTFTQISGIATTALDGNGYGTACLVAIDQGNPNYVYISTYNTGIYRSTTGVTGTFTLIGGTNAPTQIRQMEVCSDGTLWAAGYGIQYIYKIARGTGNTWTRLGTTQHGIGIVAGMGVNPTNSSIIYVNDGEANCNYSNDGGTIFSRNDGQAAWSGNSTLSNYPYQNYTDVPFDENFKGFKGGSKSLMDAAGVMWTAHGTGANKFTPITDQNATLNFYDESKGIEQLGLYRIKKFAGNPRLLLASFDKGLVRPIDVDRFSGDRIFIDPALSRYRINHAVDLDSFDGNYIVCAMGFMDQQHGRSKDGGKTWAKFPTQPNAGGFQMGGAICSTGVNKAIYLPAYDAVASYTLDDGSTWQPLNLPGAGSSGTGNWNPYIFSTRFMAAADKQRSGYAAVVTSFNHPSGAAVWVTADHGVTWTKKFNGVIDAADPAQFYNCLIDYIPGHAGELFYTCGNAGNYYYNNYLWKSSNDGLTWTQVRSSEIRGVYFFAFGQTPAGASYPITYIYAIVNGVRGLYYSLDNFATTPVLISKFPGGNANFSGANINDIVAIEGDKNPPANVAGRCYFSWSGGGTGYVDLLDKASGY